MPQPTAAGNCINSTHYPTGTVRYVCQGHHRTFISYTAPKTSFGITWRAKQMKKTSRQWACHDKFNCQQLDCVLSCKDDSGKPNQNLETRLCDRFFFFFFVSNTNFQFGRTCNNTLNKALVSCSYLIIMRILPNPHVLIIYYTEVSTLLIQKVALVPIN